MKASASNPTGNCLDVSTPGRDIIEIVETDNPYSSITTNKANFAAFITGVKAGEFDHFVHENGSSLL